MTIYLGITFGDQQLLPTPPTGVTVMAWANLVAYLESFYALGAPQINRTALRTEQYRQVIKLHQEEEGPGFYTAAFRADEFAAAVTLLDYRDELLEAGYALDQPVSAKTPARLRTLQEFEALLLTADNELDLLPGMADRLQLLLAALEEDRHPRLNIWLNEPRHLWPPGAERLFQRLEQAGDRIRVGSGIQPAQGNSDLERWQRQLLGGSVKDSEPLKGDGSLILLSAERETHLAAYLGRLLRDNQDWRPGVLLGTRSQTLDNALVAEGLPSLGIPSSSLARPSLQVLKLITAFLWDPIEVDRIMEFVSLTTKPLHWRLGQRIALHLADTPGLFGPGWFRMLEGFFREMEEERGWSMTKLREVREQYEGWFRRKRYQREERIPKFQLSDLFNNLRNWALEAYTDGKQRSKDQPERREQTGLLVLAAQALRAIELLETQPEDDLSYLEVERLVRTVYEPAPAQFQPKEQGTLATIFSPACAVTSAPKEKPTEPVPKNELEKLVWWDFIERESGYFFHRFYPDELAYLEALGVYLNSPERQNELENWQQLRPVLLAQEQLVLCLPARVDGSEVEPHPLLGDLEAAFPEGSLARITIEVDAAERVDVLGQLTAPTFSPVAVVPLDRPRPQLLIERMKTTPERERESPTALEDLLYYPHKWVFRHQLKLKGSPILSIVSEHRLRGNLSHLFIERLLNGIKAGEVAMEQGAIRGWIDANWRRLLEQEGAVLLSYGQEPERVQFVRTMQYSAWSLVRHIKRNGWRIRGSEERVEGDLEVMGQSVRGRADLILEREDPSGKGVEVAIVDLKWRGKSVFKNLLRNAKDIQLCLYAAFIAQNKPVQGAEAVHTAPQKVHTAYFVLRDALLLARNELAFANIEVVTGTQTAEEIQATTLRKVRATYNWRWEQFREGVVEVRCQETIGWLEDLYLDLPHDALLEPETEDARFDDYRSLIGLVR
ncbi:MAG: PD-(D/E)XK nuclease family protein [Bacteroidota bacterium]